MSNDSSRLVLVERASEELCRVVQFCSDTFARVFSFEIGGYFIKAKDLA